ncbi:hypothetical protein SAMN05421538_101370 [Paracoccus isoporae]|uniref:Uncharacterized protein n=1 Tax=Paracoccus isoporae TaxID=591205 RepID=A0A1G6TTY2_9RHOB|nr:DUF6173 family protein [Paracoccus isoporae]SDD32491.1 hypothetical protein SAMN05421538_101370 [Paracoccus isoporae]
MGRKSSKSEKQNAKGKTAKPEQSEKEAAPPALAPVAEGHVVCDEADQAVMQAAKQVYDHLIARVKAFQESLPEKYELGIQLANFGGERAVHVRGMGYRNPNIIEFYGLLEGQTQVAVVQHVSQLNFMLVAVPPVAEQEPYRIGFGADI